MTDVHATHRPFLAALADGELELVPAATREHVDECDQCHAELEAHELLGRRLRDAVRAGEPAATGGGARSRFLVPLAAAAALVLVIAGAVLATRPSSPDPLAAAVLVASRQPQYQSSSSSDIAAWCTEKYGNRVPEVALQGLQPIGARMDWPHDVGVATVTYSFDGSTVHVSWLALNAGRPQPQLITVSGKPAVLVRAHGITALVTGDAPQAELLQIGREVAISR
jgi:hypothetical protein